jgi:hypothetical protein
LSLANAILTKLNLPKVLTIRITPELLSKAEARAARLGLNCVGYVRSLIEHDLHAAASEKRNKFTSEDLVGSFRLGGMPATNRQVRENLIGQEPKSETHCRQIAAIF